MISIADLLVDERIPSDYFANEFYVKGDIELGLLENRQGNRLIAIPETLIQGIYAGLEQEIGQNTNLVLFNCGRWWGKNLYTRFCDEVTDYYQVAVADMTMVEFMHCLRQCWATHGWGQLDLDQTYQQQGFLVISVTNSPFAKQAANSTRPACALEAGVLSVFFSQLTSRELHCVQTTCESMGADCNRFILGLQKRLSPVEALVSEGMEHKAIMEQLCA
ncbi:MAG: 4-vinyl reductase [Cyanothece sp. SIO2G6]|nr:4-vinyl reductase [Cyanothece sp. SIO2G6]